MGAEKLASKAGITILVSAFHHSPSKIIGLSQHATRMDRFLASCEEALNCCTTRFIAVCALQFQALRGQGFDVNQRTELGLLTGGLVQFGDPVAAKSVCPSCGFGCTALVGSTNVVAQGTAQPLGFILSRARIAQPVQKVD